MKLSIIIPCYNEEKWITKTVESVLAQDFQDFEIILVDNASTDRTPELLSQLKEKYPKKINVVSESRRGVSFAREAGRIASKGEIMAQLDADCLVPIYWAKNALTFFDKPSIVGVAGSIDYYDGEWRLRYGTIIAGFILPIMNIFAKRKKRFFCWGANIFIRSHVLAEAGGYRKGVEFYGEEFDTVSKIMRFGNVKYSRSFQIKTSARRFNSVTNPWSIMKKYNRANSSVLKKELEIGEETIHPR